MKAILICPDARPPLAKLAAVAPLVTWPILGKSLVEYWLEHLVALGAKEVCLLAADRPDQVRSHVGDGARWGLSLTCSWMPATRKSVRTGSYVIAPS